MHVPIEAVETRPMSPSHELQLQLHHALSVAAEAEQQHKEAQRQQTFKQLQQQQEEAERKAAAEAARQKQRQVVEREEVTAFVQSGGVLTMYLASGKRKHDRYFWVGDGRVLSWDKKKAKPGKKANKSERLESVSPNPEIRSANEWFAMIDAEDNP